MKDLSFIFEKKPNCGWGSRGNPYLWNDLRRYFAGKNLEYGEERLIMDIYNIFLEKTDVALGLGVSAYVDEYAHGGMSSGYITGDFWILHGIPCLLENYKRIKLGYSVVTLCGSTRFKYEFDVVEKRLTLEGKIVISANRFGYYGDEDVWDALDDGTLEKTKTMLDDLNKCKIDMADGIYVINVGGYIGERTKCEIKYAKEQGKTVSYLESVPEKRT